MTEPRRSLVLAGGALKVAYQAGVLQVWLDEAGLSFDHADGASGGVLNLAMWCQGRTGTQIADAWRAYRPLRVVTPDLAGLRRGPWAEALLTSRGVRDRLLPAFELDWERIRATSRTATFNLFNASRQEHVVLPPAQLTPDLLVSAVALPLWFPPVRAGGDAWIDAVFATDANIGAALDHGADEIWVIWTVSTRGDVRRGLAPAYFSMIEASANSRLRADLDRLARNAAERAAGRPGEFGRDVTLRLLSAEVPLHYLLVFRRTAVVRAVELGVRDARAWCAAHGVPTRPAPIRPAPDRVTFRETMAGRVQLRDGSGSVRLRLVLDVEVDDVQRFAVDPEHVARVHGWVVCPALGTLAVEQGIFNVLVDDAGEKQMRYELQASAPDGSQLQISGIKHVRPGRLSSVWADTTTLFTTARLGGLDWADGVLRVSLPGFLRQLSTFRAQAPTAAARAGALTGFVTFFLGRLWAVYGPPPPPSALPAAWLHEAGAP